MGSGLLMHLFWIFYFRFAARLPIFFLNRVLRSFDISFLKKKSAANIYSQTSVIGSSW